METNPRLKYVAMLAFTLLGVVLYVSRNDLALLLPRTRAEAGGFEPRIPPAANLSIFDRQKLTVPEAEIFSGGPGKDGIPSLTDPEVTPAESTDFLAPEDRVVGVNIGDTARAYPISILNWHEVVNDVIGETPIVVVYCPLCDSVSVADRRMEGQTLEFGVSGLLHNSNVLLYDRTEQALWSQVGFEAISGPRAGQSLKHLTFELTTFKEWKGRHPAGTVVNTDTGYRRNYAQNPYQSYFASPELMFPVKDGHDPRLPLKERVVGIRLGALQRAYPLQAIINAPDSRLEDTLDGKRVVLESSKSGEPIRIVELPPEAQVVHTFWFAWAAFFPQTTLYDADSAR